MAGEASSAHPSCDRFRGARGGVAAGTQMLPQEPPSPLVGEGPGMRETQAIGSQPAFASWPPQRTPHPSRTFGPIHLLPSRGAKHGPWRCFSKNSKTAERAPSPLVRGEGWGEGCAEVAADADTGGLRWKWPIDYRIVPTTMAMNRCGQPAEI